MRALLQRVARQAISACRADVLTAAALRRDKLDKRPCHLLAVGKAAGAMARGALDVLAEQQVPLRGGVLVTKAGHTTAPAPLTSLIGSHPEPSEASAEAGRALLRYLAEVPAGEQVLALVSGGTSALIATPRQGVSVAELASASRTLLASGVDITRMNAQRGKLSAVAAGGLARACPAPIKVVLLSDVLGDDPATIGSGPFWTAAGAAPACAVSHSFAGSYSTLLDAAASAAEREGVRRQLRFEAEQDDVAAVAQRWAARLRQAPAGTLLLGGGEPTVTLPERPGRGGRNQHLALLMADELRRAGRPCAFAAVASDGDDGNSAVAGAVVDERSWQRMEQLDAAPQRALDEANSHQALAAAELCVDLGPTGTNLLDLHLLWVGGGEI